MKKRKNINAALHHEPPFPFPYTIFSLGLSIGGTAQGGGGYIGFGLLEIAERGIGEKTVSYGTAHVQSDPIETAIAVALKASRNDGISTVRLFRFTEKSFPRSRAAREGMSHAEHERLVSLTSARLQAEGLTVEEHREE